MVANQKRRNFIVFASIISNNSKRLYNFNLFSVLILPSSPSVCLSILYHLGLKDKENPGREG